MDRTEYYSTRDLHERLNIPLKTIQDWARDKKIPGQIRMGRMWMFHKKVLDEALSNEDFLTEAEV